MPYIDEDYVDEMIGSDLRTALFTDAGAYDGTRLTRFARKATGRVRVALEGAGYTPPSDANLTAMLSGSEAQIGDAEAIRSATFGVFIRRAAFRKQWPIPDGVKEELTLVKDIEKGDVAFSTLSLDEGAAVGGAEFSPNTTDTTENWAPVFNRNMGR